MNCHLNALVRILLSSNLVVIRIEATHTIAKLIDYANRFLIWRIEHGVFVLTFSYAKFLISAGVSFKDLERASLRSLTFSLYHANFKDIVIEAFRSFVSYAEGKCEPILGVEDVRVIVELR